MSRIVIQDVLSCSVLFLDIDECKDKEGFPCYGTCVNKGGNYTCQCKRGYSGDAKIPGGCRRRIPILQLSLGNFYFSHSLDRKYEWILIDIYTNTHTNAFWPNYLAYFGYTCLHNGPKTFIPLLSLGFLLVLKHKWAYFRRPTLFNRVINYNLKFIGS